jgi:hypothetical protein
LSLFGSKLATLLPLNSLPLVAVPPPSAAAAASGRGAGGQSLPPTSTLSEPPLDEVLMNNRLSRCKPRFSLKTKSDVIITHTTIVTTVVLGDIMTCHLKSPAKTQRRRIAVTHNTPESSLKNGAKLVSPLALSSTLRKNRLQTLSR